MENILTDKYVDILKEIKLIHLIYYRANTKHFKNCCLPLHTTVELENTTYVNSRKLTIT